MHAEQINALCSERGWTRSRLTHELRRAAKQHGVQLPGDESIRRMVREWASGRRGLSEFYAELLGEVFGAVFTSGLRVEPDESADIRDQPGELESRLAAASTVDTGLVQLFDNQTAGYRLLDRRLGAARLLQQCEAHIAQMSDLMNYSLPNGIRTALAGVLAEAAALAGWQALDLGSPAGAWRHHETAKSAAREAGSPTVLAHVSAQQAYALLDLGRATDAAEVVRRAREDAGTHVPALLRSWLWAAEAETLAGSGHDDQTRHALDMAGRLLPADPADPGLPFVFLDEVHLGRWRGHCLARLGSLEAVDELTHSLARLDPTFQRAAAALHCDLALAHSTRGEHDAASSEAKQAEALATRTASARQRRRINRILATSDAAGR